MDPHDMKKKANRELEYESTHVHDVYEQIASHFSSTRYKPWPVVDRFLHSLPDGSIGLDVGCGNGKYLGARRGIYVVGSDRSHNLTTIAKGHQQHDALVADAIDLPHPTGRFDFAICIAVIHHFSTRERRVAAVRAVLDTLNAAGSALFFAWALEQKGSRRGWDEGGEQDVMVPWVLQEGKGKKKKGQDAGDAGEGEGKMKTFLRYYHLYKKGELEEDVRAAGGVVLEAGFDRDNWWAVAGRAG